MLVSHNIERMYGRVTNVVNNGDFSVVYDIDKETEQMSLSKCVLEPRDTPVQTITVVTAEDFQCVSQGTSSDRINEVHFDACLQSEQELVDGRVYTLTFNDYEIFEATYMKIPAGDLVHNKPLLYFEGKFAINDVLPNVSYFPAYDKDYHTDKTFIKWNVSATKEKTYANGKGRTKRLTQKAVDYKEEDGLEEGESDVENDDADDQSDDDFLEDDNVKSLLNKSKKKGMMEKKRKIIAVEKKDEVGKKKGKRNKANKEDQIEKGNETEKETAKGEKKKAKVRKIRQVAKITIGKEAADKKKNKNKDNKIEEENILDYEEEVEEEEVELPSDKKKEKLVEEKKIWKEGRRRVDPRGEINLQSARLLDPTSNLWDEDSFLDYYFTFIPVDYVKEVMLPATNHFAQDNGHTKPFSFQEFINAQGILYMMESVRLSDRRSYWRIVPDGYFPGLNFGKAMSCNRFEEFLNVWQLSAAEDMDQQVLDFLDAVNDHLKKAMRAGEVLCLDESMIKSFHRGLMGKMKIIRKPRPIGNELKTVSDAETHIVLHMELHEAKEDMADKEYVKELGATAACSLRITEYWRGTGRIVVGDSWFGSVKTCTELWKTNGLYSIMIVKTAHKLFPREMLRSQKLDRGQWTSTLANIDGLEVTATRFIDLQEKLFISSTSTDLDGPPRKTKYSGDISRPQIAYDYLSKAASIDIHNHYRTGSVGLEDVWQTKSAHMRQAAGIFGFLFTNSYLAYIKFQRFMLHSEFKIKLANALMDYVEKPDRPRRESIEAPLDVAPAKTHVLKLLEKPVIDKFGNVQEYNRYQRECFYCQHNPLGKPQVRKTSYFCEGCVGPRGQVYPLCNPNTGRHCFRQHIENGLPSKRRYSKK